MAPRRLLQRADRQFSPSHSLPYAVTTLMRLLGDSRPNNLGQLLSIGTIVEASGRRQALKQSAVSSHHFEHKEGSVASQLVKNYHRLQRPAKHNVVFSKALEEFTSTAVLAYECGYSEGLVREEISSSQASPSPAAELLEQDDIDECMLALALVWITLSMLPSASKRWATGQAVSDLTRQRWSGFVRMIVKGYHEKRWAAYPIDRLQVEISLATGRLERPSVVAEWSRLVYAALEHVAPQWPTK